MNNAATTTKTLAEHKKQIQMLHYERDDIWSEYSKDLDIYYKTQIHERMRENADKLDEAIADMIGEHPNRIHCYKTAKGKWEVTCRNSKLIHQTFDERWMAESYAKAWRKLGIDVDCKTLNDAWDPYNLKVKIEPKSDYSPFSRNSKKSRPQQFR